MMRIAAGATLVILILIAPHMSHAGTAMTARTLLVPTEVKQDSVKIEAALVTLFERNDCNLPAKIRKKLKKESGSKSWIPGDLRTAAESVLDKEATMIDGTNVRAVLHSAQYSDGTATKDIRVTGASTYGSLDTMKFVDGESDNFVYSLDCSGFLNSAISAGGGFSGFGASAKMQSAATAALKTQRAIVAARASIFFPIAVALNPDVAPHQVPVTRRERLDVLYALLAELPDSALDTWTVSSWREVALVWTSKAGTASFQGKATLDASAGASGGGASISTASSAGGALSRSISFGSFDTYLLDTSVLEPVSKSVKDVRGMIAGLARRSAILEPTKKVNATYVVSIDLPSKICRLDWDMYRAGTETSVAGTVRSTVRPEGCEIQLAPQGATPTKGISLKSANTSGANTQLEIFVPIPPVS